LLSGAFIVENIMAWPGLGRLTMEAFFAKDSYLVVDCVVMATALLVIGNFIADIVAGVERPAHPSQIKWKRPAPSSKPSAASPLSPWRLFWRRLKAAENRHDRRRDFDFSLCRRHFCRLHRALSL
jgi:hypothetical protein